MTPIKYKLQSPAAPLAGESLYQSLVTAVDVLRRDMERLEALVGHIAPRSGADSRRGSGGSRMTLSQLMERLIADKKRNGRLRTAGTYRAALDSFRRFLRPAGPPCADGDIDLADITPSLMEDYEAWLRRRGLVPNTVSFYTRILRAAYNRAVEWGLIADRRPFRHVYTGIDKTVKRALPLTIIRRIKRLDLSHCPALDYARDMFMMSFYLRGMSFIDMAYLKKSDLRGGSVIYRRRKTGRRLEIGWTAEMQHILDKYPADTGRYLLPILKETAADSRSAYRRTGYNINRSLRKVAALAGITAPLTLYVARHSWASCVRDSGIPVGVISEGMGHGTEATTRIYLSSLDTSVIDKANARLLASL